jgi:hypothetical protein
MWWKTVNIEKVTLPYYPNGWPAGVTELVNIQGMTIIWVFGRIMGVSMDRIVEYLGMTVHRILVEEPAVLIEIFHSFRQSSQANARLIHWNRPRVLHSHPVQGT